MNEQNLDIYKIYRQDVMKNLPTMNIDELCEKYYEQNDISVYDDLVNATLHIVVKIARRYVKPGKFELEDLIQEGNLGLLRAIEMFDYIKGYKFETYATYHIRNRIQHYTRTQGSSIKIPNYQVSIIHKIRKEFNELEDKIGIGSVDMKMVARNLGMEASEVEYLYCISKELDSINKLVIDDGQQHEYSDVIEDKNYNVEDIVVEKNIKDEINKILKEILNERQIYVLSSRFGIGSNGIITYEALSKQLGITKQRVYQIEKDVLKKLKNQKSRELMRLL